MSQSRRLVFVSLLGTLCLVLATSAAAESDRAYRVLVHPDNTTSGLTRDQLSDLFLGKRQAWSGGEKVALVEPCEDSTVRPRFIRDVHGQSSARVDAYWRRQVLTGRSLPPTSAATDREVIAFVAERRGAIGYVDAETVIPANVREIGVIEAARLLDSREPSYTASARRFGIEGTVVLEVEVDANGSVQAVEPLRSLTHGLTGQAMRAVRGWRYEPATLGGRPVTSTLQVAIHFTR
ncbi:MAG: TonB family protein [Acidobacteriota bacterium]